MFLRGNYRLEFLFALQNYDKYPNQEKYPMKKMNMQ